MLRNPLVLRLLRAWIGRRVLAVLGQPLPEPPFLVSANHTSYFDHFVIAFVLISRGLPFPRFLSKPELFATPLSAWFNRLGGGIPVARGRVDTEAFAEAEAVLATGGVLIVYPEGTRSRDGSLHPPRRGVAALAARTGVPVVPIGLLGVDQVQPIGSHWPKRTRRIVVNVDVALPAPSGGRAEEQRLTRRLSEQLSGLTSQWPSFVGEPARAGESTPLVAGRAAAPPDAAADRAHSLVELGFRASDARSAALFRNAERSARASHNPYADLERGRALGQLATREANPLRQLDLALRSKRLIDRSVHLLPDYPLAWHVWASLYEQLPGWLGGDQAKARVAHRVAASLDPRWPRGLYHLCLVNLASGRESEARRWLALLLTVADGADAVQLARARELAERIALDPVPDPVPEAALAAPPESGALTDA